MCCFQAKIETKDGSRNVNRFVCKSTKWMTNSKALAEALEKRCSNSNEPPFHRHIVLNGGLAKMGTTYAPELVNTVLRGADQCQPTCFTGSLLVSCSLCLHIFAMASMSQPRVVDASGTPVPHSPMQHSSSNFGPLHGSGSDLTGVAPAPEVPRMRSSMPFFQSLYISNHRSRKFLLSRQMSRMDSQITKTLVDSATRLAEMEQNFSTLFERRCKVETYKKLTAPQPLGHWVPWPRIIW